MKLSELTLPIDGNGELRIPSHIISEMGLAAGASVSVSFLTKDGKENTYREVLLSADPILSAEPEMRVMIPNDLLAQAAITQDQDLQIICVDGAIIISRDSSLRPDEFPRLLETLKIASDLTSSLSGYPVAALDQLEEIITSYQEGEFDHEQREC